MLLESNELANETALRCDLCIVGAGAAGITIALELATSGMDVLLLESGGLKPEKATQDLYGGSVVDERLHSPPIRYRQRMFGGTTTIWGGRCMPFDEIDFEKRDYVPNSGWPIGRDALLPYYERANQLCEAGDFSYRANEVFGEQLPPMIAGFESSNFSADTLERFSCPTNFGNRYQHKLASNPRLRLLLHANVTAIELDSSGDRVAHLTVQTLAGKRFTAVARNFVLAVGGLEVARLLLSNRDVHAQGIGNRHDVVGRYYMCHVAGTIGRVQINGPLDRVHHGYNISSEGVYCRRRLALRPDVQRTRQLGNFIARLHHPRITDPAHRNSVLSLLYLAKYLIPYEYRKRLHDDNAGTIRSGIRHVMNVITGPQEAIEFAWHMLRDRKLAARKFPSIIIRSKANLYSLDFHAEQQPDPASRVILGDGVDSLGVPRLKIDWRYTAGDVDTVTRALALLAADFRSSGIGHFEYDAASVEAEMTRYGAYGGHHIGTARMGNDRRSSVVDSNCRLHDVENLYIASAATFPTSSQANPTLTVVALAARLAAHLRSL
ncbi:MAG: FAD-dependent oxidoreductase [Steroidobacteraceae bacterium]